MDRMTRGAARAAKWLEQQLQDDGSYGPEVDDLACYYKSPYLFALLGMRSAAHLVLNHIKERFFQSNGDFNSSEACKSINLAFCEYWAYTNGWIAIAAQRMGRFDVSIPAYDYLRQFFHPKLGGFTTHKPHASGNEVVDILTTSHLGLASLYFGEVDRAKKAGAFLSDVLDKQPDPTTRIFLRADGRGQLVTTFPHEMAAFHVVSAREPNQAYFMVGYPIAFLGKLYLATLERRFLNTAKRYMDFILKSTGNVTQFHFSHKVMWGASLLAAITGEVEYASFATRIADFLINIQSAEAPWLQHEPFHVMADQTAENAIWLTETCDELSRMQISTR